MSAIRDAPVVNHEQPKRGCAMRGIPPQIAERKIALADNRPLDGSQVPDRASSAFHHVTISRPHRKSHFGAHARGVEWPLRPVILGARNASA
jgi:hypothetical protein